MSIPRLRCAALQRIAPETPFEGACGLIVRADELLGALAQMRSAGVARMAQHPARVAGKPEFDLIDPACVQRREVQVKALAVPLVERMPDGLGAMRVQIVPDNVHLF